MKRENNIQIFVLTGPVRSGKTSSLMQLVQDFPSAGGILTPVIEKKRYLYGVREGVYYRFECNNENEESAEILRVGSYRLYKDAFKRGGDLILENFRDEDCSLILVDEIGKLELNGEGFDTSIRQLLKLWKAEDCTKVIIFIVREYLLNQVIHSYGIGGAILIRKEQLSEILGNYGK